VNASHSEIACRLIAELPPGVFAHAARDGVIHQDFVMLERLLPGVRFAVDKVAVDEWQLTGACEDGSIITWLVGA
jgi:hypothetical protein